MTRTRIQAKLVRFVTKAVIASMNVVRLELNLPKRNKNSSGKEECVMDVCSAGI